MYAALWADALCVSLQPLLRYRAPCNIITTNPSYSNLPTGTTFPPVEPTAVRTTRPPKAKEVDTQPEDA